LIGIELRKHSISNNEKYQRNIGFLLKFNKYITL